MPRRHLGDSFDQRLTVQWSNFVTTVDSKFILACGYPDYSFRVIETDTGEKSWSFLALLIPSELLKVLRDRSARDPGPETDPHNLRFRPVF